MSDQHRLRLGPDSVLGRLASDPRIAFTGFSAGVIQLMHPAVSAAVLEHSDFFTDPFDRIYRSIPRIVNSITEPDSLERAVRVRDYHRDIKGVDADGHRYHALDPDVYWWTHATFVWAFLAAADRFHHRPPAGAERERYYAESVEWWSRYGMTMRPVAPDLATFEADFVRTCREDLQWTRAADLSLRLKRVEVPGASRRANELLSRPLTPLTRLVMVGGIPATVRDRFPIPWSPADQRCYDLVARTMRTLGRAAPDGWVQRRGRHLMRQLERSTALASEARAPGGAGVSSP